MRKVSQLWGIENTKEIAPLTVAVVFVIHCTQLKKKSVQGGKQNHSLLVFVTNGPVLIFKVTAEASILTYQDEDLKTWRNGGITEVEGVRPCLGVGKVYMETYCYLVKKG